MKPTALIIGLWMRMDMGRYPEFAPKVTGRHNTEVQLYNTSAGA